MVSYNTINYVEPRFDGFGETELKLVLNHLQPKDLIRLERVNKLMASVVRDQFMSMRRLDLLDLVTMDWGTDKNQRLFEKLFNRCGRKLKLIVYWPIMDRDDDVNVRTWFLCSYVKFEQIYARLVTSAIPLSSTKFSV